MIPLKEIFHTLIGDRCHRWLNSQKSGCCRKPRMYRLFEEAHTIFDHEIDIVRLIQHFRFLRDFTKNLVI